MVVTYGEPDWGKVMLSFSENRCLQYALSAIYSHNSKTVGALLNAMNTKTECNDLHIS